MQKEKEMMSFAVNVLILVVSCSCFSGCGALFVVNSKWCELVAGCTYWVLV